MITYFRKFFIEKFSDWVITNSFINFLEKGLKKTKRRERKKSFDSRSGKIFPNSPIRIKFSRAKARKKL